MVDGVHGDMDHAVRVVVVEHNSVLEDVTILHLPVEEVIVMAQVLMLSHATLISILVRYINNYVYSIKQLINKVMNKYIHTYVYAAIIIVYRHYFSSDLRLLRLLLPIQKLRMPNSYTHDLHKSMLCTYTAK